MSFDAAELALKTVCPGNVFLYDDKEMPSTFVYIPKFRLCDVLSTEDTTIHPAFRVGGVEIDGFYFGKFQTHHYNSRAYSLPGEDPSANATLDTFVACARAKGGNFHEITNAEWAAVALWCHKNGTEPYGNNNYGKDRRETLYKAIPTTKSSGQTNHVATGTGPITWSHDRTLGGIWDMNGNVSEWCTSLRLVKGEVQVIVDNNAADPTADLSATSAAWMAINAAATGWADLFIEPDGSGTTSGSVKLDYVSSKWKWDTTISSSSDSSRNCAFKDITASANIGDTAKLLLMALALLPDTALTGDNIDATYGGDYFYANNEAAERCLYRGGSWSSGASNGVFCALLSSPRSHSYADLGGRSASY